MDDSERPVIRVICGPTGAGKSALALRCALFADVTIVSADSRQLYTGFDVGTAKPGRAERAAVPHEGIDVLDPTMRASAAWWAGEADAWLEGAIHQGRVPLVVGGTGLYLRALLGTLFEEIPMDVTSRGRLQVHFAATSVDELRRWVGVLDPARAALGRTQLLRAIEVALLTGRPISALHEERARPSRWRARYLLVDPGPPLRDQIAGRTRVMFDSGWPDEVRALMQNVSADAPAWNASGYRTVRAMVEGQLTLEEAVDDVVIETRQYAKRQRTWFRHQLAGEHVTTIDPTAGDVGARLEAWWSEQVA